MKSTVSFALITLVSLTVAGCAGTSISKIMGSDTASVTQARANQDLTMPPDLRLPAPGTITSEAQATATAEPAVQTATAKTEATASPIQGAKEGDVYERNGISKIGPDGKPKTQADLQAELRKVYLAKKRQQNPNAGTIFNIGNIFKDG